MDKRKDTGECGEESAEKFWAILLKSSQDQKERKGSDLCSSSLAEPQRSNVLGPPRGNWMSKHYIRQASMDAYLGY